MSDIFISYSRSDEKVAKSLAHGFEQCGWTVFWDRRIPPGRMWADVIEFEIEEAKCVVVLWSRGSLRSKWVKEEAGEANDQGKLLPVRIEDEKPPLGFRQIHCADLTQWEPGTYEAYAFRFLVQSTADIGNLVPAVPVALPSKDPAPSTLVVRDETPQTASSARPRTTKQTDLPTPAVGEWYNAFTGGGTADVEYECRRCAAKGWIEKVEWFRDGDRPPSKCQRCGYTG